MKSQFEDASDVFLYCSGLCVLLVSPLNHSDQRVRWREEPVRKMEPLSTRIHLSANAGRWRYLSVWSSSGRRNGSCFSDTWHPYHEQIPKEKHQVEGIETSLADEEILVLTEHLNPINDRPHSWETGNAPKSLCPRCHQVNSRIKVAEKTESW